MRRRFRLWQKKRGDRRTGSRLLGNLGEILFFAIVFLLGAVSMTGLFVAQFNVSTAQDIRLGFGFWVMVLVLASFLLIGGGGFLYALLEVGTSAERRSALARRAANLDLLSEARRHSLEYPTLPSDHDLVNSPGIKLAYRLPTTQSPLWQLSAAGIFCLLWNGLAAVLIVLAVNRLIADRPDWSLNLLIVPFLAVGAWSLRHFLRQIITLTALGPTIVEISEPVLRPGESCEVFVSQGGHLVIQSLALSLVCDEEATYHQGTDLRVDRHRVFERDVFQEDKVAMEPGRPFERTVTVHIPLTAMHSFQSPHNRVLWHLVVRGQPEGRPPLEVAFPLIIYPPTTPAAPPESRAVPAFPVSVS